ncbi:unnamed protein product [Adineta steineri]|nr:unnamed protein product [Adineta steineri]
MTFNYYSTVKKYLDQNRIDYSLPEYIQRGWDRIYTLEEKEFNQRPCIIGSDVQIPNSIVRHRLGTQQRSMKANIETLRNVFELPKELLMNLSIEHELPNTIEEENISFEWNDEDDDTVIKHRKSIVSTIINKQREKRRKYEDYKYNYDNSEPLPIDEIIEEIQTNIGKDLKTEDLNLITELMQIISRYKQAQIMNIYDELSDIHLISKFGGVPKLVQALQEIQRAFEQVAMKTNVASIETVIDVLLEKDHTYRVAVELLNSFNENMKKHKQQQMFNLNNKSATSDLTILINDLQTIQNIDTSQVNNKDHDDQVKFLSEQLNTIFTRAHFDGIKTTFHSMKSSVSDALQEFIDKTEISLKTKLTEHDNITIESYIQDRLTLLNNNELKRIYERLAQQGILKRHIGSGELNQTITMGLMKKINTDGLGIVIENMKEAHLDIDSMSKLLQELICINNYIQTQSSISIEQIQNHLAMAYFIETSNLSEQNIQELAKSTKLYSIVDISLSDKATKDEYSIFLEQLKSPFIRICIQRILNSVNENTIDLSKVSNEFYKQYINDLLHELIYGSEEFNRNLLFHQVQEQLKKNKDLVDKIYRQMLKEKLINIDTKIKIDTDKKKVSIISNDINRILNNKEDRAQQSKLIELFNKIDVPIPERIKHWYKTKSSMPVKQLPLSNLKKETRRPNAKLTNTIPKTLREGVTRDIKDRSATISSSKHGNGQKKPSVKLQQKRPEMNKSSKILDPVSTTHPTISTTTTDVINTNVVSKLQDDSIKPIDTVIPERDNQLSNIVHTTSEHKQEFESSPYISTEIQSDILEQSDEKTNEIATSTRIETIRSESTTIGKVGDNKTINFELEHDAALLLYSPLLPNDPEQEVHMILNGKISEFISDSQYEKTKAQRVLAKAIPTNSIRQQIDRDTIVTNSSLSNLIVNNEEIISAVSDTRKLSNPSNVPGDELLIPITTPSLENIKSMAKTSHRTTNKSLKQTDDIYINSLTNALHNLFSRSEYDNNKLRKIHDELITSGHISPLNEFYRSSSEALRLTLDHCVTYNDLIKWTLSLLQTQNKPNLIDFGHDLYSIAIDLDLSLIERIDNTQCAFDIQEHLKHDLQTISETDLREINSYLNASQMEKLINITKKLNVTSKDRMIVDLYSYLLHLIQNCHTFKPKYRPMQIYLRVILIILYISEMSIAEIAETFKSRAMIDLIRKINEIEKHLSKMYSITFFGLSKRMNESRFILTK